MRRQTNGDRVWRVMAALTALGAASAWGFGGIEAGPLKIGGALRASYVQGDYAKDDTGGPQRGGNGGDFELDVFRVNLDFEKDGWLGKAVYRWYDGYNFLHTGWAGYESDKLGRIELGLNRIPFGVGQGWIDVRRADRPGLGLDRPQSIRCRAIGVVRRHAV